MIISCPVCQKTFEVVQSRAASYKYCSYDCRRRASELFAEQRFWAKVDKSGDCWLWTGTQLKAGYGLFSIHGKYILAHRYAYEKAHGPIPDEALICHRCDTPSCVNPDHLFPGSQQENITDKVSKSRQARGDQSGARLYPERYRTKLNDQQVREFIARYRQGGITLTKLAAEFGISQALASFIVNGKRRVIATSD